MNKKKRTELLENYRRTIIANVIRMRVNRKMTQLSLARQLGVNRVTVSQMEAQVRGVRAEELLLLCTIFNCTVFDLVAPMMEKEDEENHEQD